MTFESRVTVRQHGTVYEVQVRAGLLGDLRAELANVLGARRCVLVTDAQVAPLIDGWTGGEAPWDAVLTVPAGEAQKTRASWSHLTDRLLDLGLGRDGAIVAVGGGVIGDLAGFVAATYLRGIPVVQVPTTLLAMIDAAVGGKVGVDTSHGKNLVGAFHPPVAVFADPTALWSLPSRDFAAGFAEAVKHGLIADAAYFAWITGARNELAGRDLAALAELVKGSVSIKASIVQRDPSEQGERAVLNAGHTIGHAVEHVLGYRLLHGECVAIGLVAECRLAEAVAGLDGSVTVAVRALLEQFGLPVSIPAEAETLSLMAAMRLDKKNRDGRVHVVLPARLGATARTGDAWTTAVPEHALETAIAASR